MKRKFTKSNLMLEKVERLIPLASQTFSKSRLQFIEKQAPLFLTHGKGARVWDVDGNEYIDFINGLLSVVLGYQYKVVDRAIKKQLQNGISFSLPSPLEYELAELLSAHIPCAEMIRFGKNGSDATNGAVRVARAFTGRDHIAVCGYHGWHNWYIGSTTRHKGVPKLVRSLTHPFQYNDLESLERILKKNECAAVIMEPMGYVEPQPNFLAEVKRLTHAYGALLIFDEIITGFRFNLGGAQKLFGVTPDLATFGKSMGNGMPISAIVGKKKFMQEMEHIFFSSTFGGETLSLAASIATIQEMEQKNVVDHLWKLGSELQEGLRKLIIAHGLEETMAVRGKPCWQVIAIQSTGGYSDLEIKSFLQQALLQDGFLWYGQHNISFSHTKKDIDALLMSYERALSSLKIAIAEGTLKKKLKGTIITNIFKVR